MIKKPLFYVLILALVLRLACISHGFPNIYHPDEPTVIRTALSVRFNPNPSHFDWPHLYVYVNYFVYMVFAKLRDLIGATDFKDTISRVAPIVFNDNLVFYLLTRILSALLGAFTLIPLYLWIKKLINKQAGLISAALLAVAPLHVRNSHYSLVDVPMLFFLTWSLYFSTFSPILGGLFLGFSASTKYNGILGGIFIFGYYLLTKRKPADFIKTGIFTVLGFILGTPYAVLDYKNFIRTDGPTGALWQFKNVGKVEFPEHLEHLRDFLFIMLPQNLGYITALVFFLGTGYLLYLMIKRKTANRLVLLSLAIFLSLVIYISRSMHNRSQYYLVVYPYFFLVLGWVTQLIMGRIKQKSVKIAMAGLVLLPSLVFSVLNIIDLASKNPTEELSDDTINLVKDTP